MSYQMLRVESFPFNKIQAVIGEANRETEYCSHVLSRQPPFWAFGSESTVRAAIDRHMKKPVEWKHKSGRNLKRKRRNDHRCLVAGFASWPTPLPQAFETATERQRVRDWCKQVLEWLKRYFGEHLFGVVLHVDEGNPHMHFFAVGDANLLHPGLMQEFKNGQRLISGRMRHERHVAGLKAFLDHYHQAVRQPFGLKRQSESPKGQRIENRDLAIRLASIEAKVSKIECEETKEELEKLKSAATYRPYAHR